MKKTLAALFMLIMLMTGAAALYVVNPSEVEVIGGINNALPSEALPSEGPNLSETEPQKLHETEIFKDLRQYGFACALIGLGMWWFFQLFNLGQRGGPFEGARAPSILPFIGGMGGLLIILVLQAIELYEKLN